MKKIFIPAIGLFVACTLSVSAQAALIGHAANNSLNTNLTWDDVTGLEWLDLSLTSGMSYLDAESTYSSFRHATHAEVTALFTTAGYDGHGGVYTYANGVMANSLRSLMGNTTYSGWQWYNGTSGLIDFNLNSSLNYKYTLSPFNTAKVDAYSTKLKTYGGSQGVGNYLVRTAVVPEPTTLMLLTPALIGLAVARRRVKK